MNIKSADWKAYQFQGVKNVIETLVDSSIEKQNESSFHALYTFLKLYKDQSNRESLLKALALIPDNILGILIRFAREYACDSEFADFVAHHRTALSYRKMPERD